MITGIICTYIYNSMCISIEDIKVSVNTNYCIFAVVIISFLGIYILLYSCLERLAYKYDISSKISKKFFCLIAIVAGVVSLFVFIREKAFPDGGAMTFIWHKWYIMPAFFAIAVLLATVVDLFASQANNLVSVISNRKEIYKKIITIIYVFLSMIFGTFYNYVNSDIYHCNALYTSVYNIMNNQGYSEYSNSIYGCYAILLRIPMKILGGEEYYNFALIMTFCIMLEYICAIYIINRITNSIYIRVLGYTAALWPYVIRVTAGFQVNVMRVLFPMILLAYLMYCVSMNGNTSHKNLRCLFAWIILTFAIIWNKESGAICLISYMLYTIICLRYEQARNGELFRKLFFLLLMVVSAPLVAFFTVDAYNYVITGKHISMHVFMFPFVGSSYADEYSAGGFVEGYNIHLHILFLLLFFVAHGMILFVKQELNDEIIIIVIGSVMALGLYIMYFISIGQIYGRLFVLNFFWVVALIYISDDLLYRVGKDVKILGFVPLIVLSSMCVSITLQSGHTLYQRAESGVYNKKDYVHFADMVADSLPKDTYMVGIGIQELCSVNNRLQMQNYYVDVPDLRFNEVAYSMVIEDISEADYVLTESETIKKNDEIDEVLQCHFEQINEWTYNDVVTYILYKKIAYDICY